MIKLSTKKEREEYLGKNIKERGAYFLVKYEGETELLYFVKYEKWREDGSDWYLEAPCDIRRKKVLHHDDEVYYQSIGHVIKDDGYAYELDCPQVAPFLPEQVEIEYVGDDEETAVNWILANQVLTWRN